MDKSLINIEDTMRPLGLTTLPLSIQTQNIITFRLLQLHNYRKVCEIHAKNQVVKATLMFVHEVSTNTAACFSHAVSAC